MIQSLFLFYKYDLWNTYASFCLARLQTCNATDPVLIPLKRATASPCAKSWQTIPFTANISSPLSEK